MKLDHTTIFQQALLELGLSNHIEFDIDKSMLDFYIKYYATKTNSSGNLGKLSNVSYAYRLAALSFIKFKQHNNLQIKEGFVYCISNPAWNNQVKIGMSQDPKKRLNQYQTYSPYRDYKLQHWSLWLDRREGEKVIHSQFQELKDHEWFNIRTTDLSAKLEIINKISKVNLGV